jgi:hypothetical protein
VLLAETEGAHPDFPFPEAEPFCWPPGECSRGTSPPKPRNPGRGARRLPGRGPRSKPWSSGADPRNRIQTLTGFLLPGRLLEQPIRCFSRQGSGVECPLALPAEQPYESEELIFCRFEQGGTAACFQGTSTGRLREAAGEQAATNLVDEGGPPPHPALAYPVPRGQIQRGIRFNGDPTQVRPSHGFGLKKIILVRFGRGLDRWSRPRKHVRPLLAQGASQKVGPPQASMPTKQTGWFAVNRSHWVRENFLRTSTGPRRCQPTRWEIVLPQSRPLVSSCRRVVAGESSCRRVAHDRAAHNES